MLAVFIGVAPNRKLQCRKFETISLYMDAWYIFGKILKVLLRRLCQSKYGTSVSNQSGISAKEWTCSGCCKYSNICLCKVAINIFLLFQCVVSSKLWRNNGMYVTGNFLFAHSMFHHWRIENGQFPRRRSVSGSIAVCGNLLFGHNGSVRNAMLRWETVNHDQYCHNFIMNFLVHRKRVPVSGSSTDRFAPFWSSMWARRTWIIGFAVDWRQQYSFVNNNIDGNI